MQNPPFPPHELEKGDDLLTTIRTRPRQESTPAATRPKLLILTQYFPPELGAPQGRLSELGLRLQELGWQVQVLTALPNYPSGEIFSEYVGKKHVREVSAGLDTVRTWVVPTQSARTVRRLVCYLSFVYSAMRHGSGLCERPDVIWVESPPLFLGIAARWLAMRWRVPYVFNVSDLWPDCFVDLGRLTPTSTPYRLMKRLELACYRGAAAVTGQSDGIVAAVEAGAPGALVVQISNGVDPDRFGRHLADPEWRRQAEWEDRTVFTFAGLHGVAQGLEQVLEAAERLLHRRDIRFALIGDGPEKAGLQTQAAARGLDNVLFHPVQPRERIPATLASADVALITLASSIGGAVPSKIYEAMASSLPILLVAEGEPADRVSRAGAGIAVPCSDIDALVAAIERLADDPAGRAAMASAGREAAETVYSRDVMASRMDALLHDIVASRGVSSATTITPTRSA